MRITPACAGNTLVNANIVNFRTDHPRVCGEHGISGEEFNRLPGSPPRVRGTLHLSHEDCHLSRITPACAGNTIHVACLFSIWWDHPRVCGEHLKRWRKSSRKEGSPPRVRGTLTVLSTPHLLARITPACAGNTILCVYL